MQLVLERLNCSYNKDELKSRVVAGRRLVIVDGNLLQSSFRVLCTSLDNMKSRD